MKNKIFLYDLSGKNNIRFSPPCWNVKLCLIHNNIDFDTIPIRFTEKEKIRFSNQTLVPIIKYNEEDKQYFIRTREDRIKKPLESLLSDKEKSRKQIFQSLMTFEKILANNRFFNGCNPGLPDFIFFGNFIWAEKCSSENLFENLPNIHKWYLNIKKSNRL